MTKLNKRFLSALLAVILLLTNFPVVSAASDSFAIYYEGETVTEVEFYEHERITVSAEGIPGGTHQWQIQIPGTEQWVNIQGQTSQTVNLSKAVVGSLMMNGSAYVRCAAISDGEEIDHTAALRTTVKKEEPAPQISAPPVVTAPAAKPTPAPTEPPVEATEAPTEPIVETEPVPEIAEPTESVEVPAESIEQTEPDAQPEVTAPVEEPVVEAIEAPVEKAETPVEVEEIPAETTAPTELESEVVATAPAEEPVVEATEAPVEKAETPVEVEEIPVETTAPTELESEVVATAPAEEPVVEATEAPAVTEAPAEIPTEPAEEKPAETFIEKVVQMLAPKANADDPGIDSNTDIVSVTIQYFYEDRLGNKGEMVMDPYVARIAKGDPLKVTVACKVFPGYEILMVGNHDGISLNDKNELIIDLDNVTDDRIYTIHYKEIMVKYYARFFLQNVYNDLYTERTNVLTQDQISQMMGYAGEEPVDALIHPEITGFSALFHQPDKIAADGSTVFEVYYDRNYYLINFDLNGGFGTAPVYARYESSFTVAAPTRPGYSFAGWQLVSGDVPADAEKDTNGLIKKIPASNVTYRAIWTQQQTKYNVVYWKENIEDNQYTYWGVDEKYAQTGSTVSGEDDVPEKVHNGEKDYFTFNPVLSEKNVLVEGDGSTVVNVYYTRNYYTLTFKATGLCTIPVGHTHTDACYDYICLNGNHTHTADCLICEDPVHVHSSSCCLLGDHEHDISCCVLTPHTTHDGNCCTKDEHAHIKSCWGELAGSTANPTSAPSNPAQGQIYRYRSNWLSPYNYYIFIGTAWYEYEGTGSSEIVGTSISPICGKDIHAHNDGACTCSNTHTHGDGNCSCSIHVHGNGNCICAIPAHTHGSSCYDCGTSEHTHVTACRRLICGIPTGHTHSSSCNSSSSTNTVKIVHRKYQASLYDIWHQDQANGTDFGLKDDNGKIYTSGQRWKPNTYYSDVIVYIGVMPPANINFTVNAGTSSTKTMHYYLQVLPGEAYDTTWDGYHYKLSNTISANLGYFLEKEDFFDIVGYEQHGSDPAFNSSGELRNESSVNFYYNRITDHYLQFKNNGIILDDKDEHGIMYGASLKDYYFEPDYPSNLEPNAYVFDQWYTSAGYYEGTEVNWETLTMPEGNLLLHARWLPVSYDVYFYMDYDQLQSGNSFQNVQDTGHGEKMVTSGIDLNPTHSGGTSYQFVGWFYLDSEGEKTAFNPAEMAVRQELHLYAEWSTMTVKEYTVSYALGSWDEETKTVIPMEGSNYRSLSKDTTGYAFEASTRTFTAKPENQLENLSSEDMTNSIWVPHTNSHSILIKGDNAENVFTFWYVPRTNIPYTVRYLDSATGQPVIINGEAKPDKEVKTNTDAVVTEQFVYVPGYIPDAFYKTLVLSANEAENVIIFYYTKDSGVDEDDDGLPDDPSARYLVTHYIQNIGSDDYSVYTTDDLIGVIGTRVEADILTISGFTFDHATPNYATAGGRTYAYGTVTSGENAATALKLELYYTRDKYGYTVEYLDVDTMNPVKESKITGKDYHFDDVITETAPQNIPGYDLYGSDTQTLKISAIESLNKITFLYTPKPLTVRYVPVCKTSAITDFGYVLVTSEYKDIRGTTAVARPAFQFMGWYSDEACQTKVADTDFYKPDVTTQNGIYDYTFYALFEPIDLTVTYNANGGNEVPTVTSHIGETVALPPATQTGYTLLGWWYDADEDGTMDEGEEYAVGSEFTMPANDVTFIAQWIDSRLAPSLNVYVGINMSFYMTSSGDLYYNIPENEPAQIHGLAAARASYPETDRNAWYIQDWAWDAELPGEPTDYLEESVLTNGKNNGAIFGIADENGLKNYLKFENADYQNIVEVWLKECKNTNGVLRKNYSSANIDWEQLSDDPNEYEVVPYVIKLHQDAHPDVAGTNVNAWHIDMIIRPAKRCKVSYLDGLDVSYTGSPVTDDNEYGEGFVIQVANAPVATKVDGNTNCYAKFLGWYYDADNSGTIEEAEKTRLYQPGDKFTVPELNKNGQVIRFIGQWDYYGYLTISQTGMREGKNESGIYEVVNSSNAVIATVMITGNSSVTLEQVPVGDYTVREISSDWTWTYNPKVQTKNVSVVVNPGEDDNKVTFEQVAISPIDWLHSENHR